MSEPRMLTSEASAAGQASVADPRPTLLSLGAKLVRPSEPERVPAHGAAESFLGGVPLPVKRMREEFVEIDPAFKLRVRAGVGFNDRGDDQE